MLHNILLSLVIKKGESSKLISQLMFVLHFNLHCLSSLCCMSWEQRENKASASDGAMKIHTMHFKMFLCIFRIILNNHASLSF